MSESEITGRVLDWLEDRPQKVKDVSERMTILKHDRNPTVRLERHLMARALWGLRQEMRDTSERARVELKLDGNQHLPTDEQRNVFHQLKKEVDSRRLALDVLNQQTLSPDHITGISTELPDGEEVVMPFLELDIAKPSEGVVDKRVPWIGIGGVASDFEQNWALWMALAMQGERVLVASYPEKVEDKPENWSAIVEKYGEGTFQVHQELFSQAIQGIAEQKGISEANFIGHSVGGEVVINLAAQEKPPITVSNLVALDPVGFEKKNIVRGIIDFAVRQNMKTMGNTEDTIKMLEQGKDTLPVSLMDFYRLGKLSGAKVITPEILEKVKTDGEFQIYVGGNSPIVNLDAVQRTVSQIDGRSVPEVYKVAGADHAFPVTHAIGFASVMSENLERKGASPKTNEVSVQDLETSAVQAILNKMKESSS